MRGLFSLLFGASMLLVIERAKAAGESPVRVHFSRMAVLLCIGLLHRYLIWWGDILAHYALVGAIAFLFTRLSARQLLLASLASLALAFTTTFTTSDNECRRFKGHARRLGDLEQLRLVFWPSAQRLD